MTEPRAFVVEWLNSLGGSAHASTQFDPARGLPQLVVTFANLSWPTLGDNRADPSLRSIDVAVTAFSAGGDRPDFAGAYAAIDPVVAAAVNLSAVRWRAASGPILVNGNDVVVSRAADPDTNCATVTATFTVTAIDLPAVGS
jgi:hypothetical protein